MRISDWSSDVCSSDLTAVNHRVTDFDAGGPSVGENASGLAREQRDQGGDQLLIGLVEQQGRGQLALKTADKLCDLGWIGRANHDRRRSEHFVAKRGVPRESGGVGAEKSSLRRVGALSPRPAPQCFPPVMPAPRIPPPPERPVESRG